MREILAAVDASRPATAADRLRQLWLGFEPKSVAGIKEAARAKQETVGIPVPALQPIGQSLARTTRERVEDFLPLACTLWDSTGREGRVVAVIALGATELVDPETIIPLLRELARTYVTWEDANRLAMDALEPIVRKGRKGSSPRSSRGSLTRAPGRGGRSRVP